MLTIEIKEDFDDPKERARRAAAKRKQKEAEANANNKSKIPVNLIRGYSTPHLIIMINFRPTTSQRMI